MPELRFTFITLPLYSLGKFNYLSIIQVLTIKAVEYITTTDLFSILILIICIGLVYNVIEAPLVALYQKGTAFQLHWI